MSQRLSFAEFCFNMCQAQGIKPEDLVLLDAEVAYNALYPKLKTCVFVDDERIPKFQIDGYERWVVVRSYQELQSYLEQRGIPDLVSLDHDLAEEHYLDHQKYELQGIEAIEYGEFTQPTGLDCAHLLIEFSRMFAQPLQKVGVHCLERAMGSANIREAINGYKTFCAETPDCYLAAVPTTTVAEIEKQNRINSIVGDQKLIFGEN